MRLFSFFQKKSSPKSPLDDDIRLWIENSFLWLMTKFGQDTILKQSILTPNETSFPFEFSGNERDALNVLDYLCSIFNIESGQIAIDFFSDQIIELDSQLGHKLNSIPQEKNKTTSGLFFDKKETGKYLIAIERTQLKDTKRLIATLAHELSHIKILGEGHLDFNDEYLTDLATVFWGLGIFTGNESFKFYSQFDKWGYSKQGYLHQQEWGYALAIYAYIKSQRNPSWINFLTPNLKSDYLKSELFIYSNEKIILK